MKMNGFNEFLTFSPFFFDHPLGSFQRHFTLPKQGGRVRRSPGASGAAPSSGALHPGREEAERGNRTLIGWCRLVPGFSAEGQPNIESEYYVRFTLSGKPRYPPSPADLSPDGPHCFLQALCDSWNLLGRARFGAGGLVSQVRFRGGRGCADGSAPQVIEHPPPEFDSRCSL